MKFVKLSVDVAAKINETTTFGQGEGDEDIVFDDMSDDDIDAVCVVVVVDGESSAHPVLVAGMIRVV